MPRSILPYTVVDVSQAARSIRQQLQELKRTPSHVEMLNILARTAGYRNYQHFRATGAIPADQPLLTRARPAIDVDAIERSARFFDREGRLTRWPSKESRARLCIWVIWARFPSGRSFSERDVNERLKELNTFDDHALLRRALVDYGLFVRSSSGDSYRRIEQPPPAELKPLLRRVARNSQTE